MYVQQLLCRKHADMLHTYTEAHTSYTLTHTCTIGDLKWVPNLNPQKLFEFPSRTHWCLLFWCSVCSSFPLFYLFVLFLSIHVRLCLLCFGACVRDLFKLKLCRVIGLQLSSVSVFFLLCFFFVIVSSHALENACFKCVCSFSRRRF